MSFFKIRSIQSKILSLFLFLLLVVQLVSFFSTFQASKQLEDIQLTNRLSNAKDVFETQFTNRSYYLSAFAETAAKDYGLKSVLQEDNKSFLVALNNHRKRINSDLAMAIDNDGLVFAQLVTLKTPEGKTRVVVGKGQGAYFSQERELFAEANTQLIKLNDRLYQLSLAPIKSGSRDIGWIGFGYLIDEDLALDLANLTDVNIAFVLNDGESSELIAANQYKRLSDGIVSIGNILKNDDGAYVHEEVLVGQLVDSNINAVLYKSKADLLASIGVEWLRLALLIALTVALSVIGAVAIARGLTQPITQLVSQVKLISQGNYDKSVAVDGSKELKELSDEFNHMTEAIVSREQTISFQAFHDSLSHLPNRNSLLKSLAKRKQAQQDFIVIQLCYLGAEDITDTLGYQVGDEVINEVAERIVKTQLGLSCFHLGGENFVLLADMQEVEPLIEQLLAQLTIRCQYENISLHLQFAVGVAISSLHNGGDETELLQKSNVALQHAKKNKQAYQVYDPQFDQHAVERLFLTNSLKQAIEQDELTLFYQPKLRLSDMTISHVEALVRWQHPEKGLIPPDAFISIAEKTGQMDALTRWVTNAAVSQYVSWQKMGFDINIAINISAANIMDKSYPDYVISLKEQHQLCDNAITLEVTEEAVVEDAQKATEILCYLREHGFKLSIDDYGTGYSSLAQLKHLPVHELKIDRSFVQHLSTDESDKIIVRSTLELAHNMGLSVVAEGIEDETALLWLKAQGCQLAQGYFISKPLPADVFEQWIENTPYHISRTKN
ncbi:bifunctional diguanylate cyclase/phosphodiesterase [Thalassotalea euphylliae]|uniref:EAL domain-containing protein n=1 Tax=Thalassotalea euphylliae TaxID=1655234 RepID=A0A3E0UHR3_9GAMM|nr:EAL domain-containing protein [Thalassotalea euphylliae]REL36419.1 EAL domain-containing protein [Thalassotalea euphylliae]